MGAWPLYTLGVVGPVRLIDAPQLRDALVAAVADGIPLSVAWKTAGLSRSTFQDWFAAATTGHGRNGSTVIAKSLPIIQGFCERIGQALAHHEAEMIQVITEAARTINKSGVKEWRAAAWLLEHGSARSR